MIEKIKQILDKYQRQDAKQFTDTVSMLCAKGVANGCYQDYAMLSDVLSILGYAEEYVIKREGGEK